MIGFEASIDAAAKAARDNAGALSMSHGQLDLNSEKARNAASALQDLASKTDEAAAAARQSGSSWETVNGIYSRGRSQLIKSAQAMGLTRSEAAKLADQILKTPDKTARLKGNLEDLEAKLKTAKSKLATVPDSRKAKVRAEIADLQAKVRQAKADIASIHDKSVTVTARYVTYKGKTIFEGSAGRMATGGPVGFPGGGAVRGPGTATSDSIPAMLSNGEYVINARSTRKYRALIEAINAGSLGTGRGVAGAGAAVASGLAGGMTGSVGQVTAAARFMAAAVTTGIKAELEIASPSKKTRALAKDVGKGFIQGLTGSRGKIQAVAKDLANDIKTAFSGKKESSLLRRVDKDTKKLLDLAAKRDTLAARIAEAKAFASDITRNAREGAGLANLGLEPEQVSAGSIKAGLGAKLAQIKQFTRYIDILAKKGLNKGLLRQILNMGPEAGYAYASALVGADKATFKSINSLQSQLDTSTTTLGRVGADALYDAGKNASKGFLKGLESQQKDLEKLMEKIAKSMQKALRKALGIRSPARKLIPDGINTARGIAVGVLQGLPHINSAMQAVAGRVTGTVGRTAVAGRPAVAGRGGGPVNVQIDVHGAMDPVAVGREIRRTLLELKRVHGLNVNLGVA
jgi:chorismate mutase